MTGKTSCGLHFVEPNRRGMLVVSVGMRCGGSSCSCSATADEALAVQDPSGDPLEAVASMEAQTGRPFAFA